jgi:hypothetical protein
MPSYFKVFPQTLGLFRGSRGDPADHIFDTMAPIAGGMAQVHVEVLFRAVSLDQDLEDFFRGFEFTAAWLPEADTNEDLDALLSLASNRAGRYPEPEDRPDDGPPTFRGVWGDANAPVIGTPFHRRFYMRKMPDGTPAPATDRFFVQPSGFSVNAENMANLKKIDPDYYGKMAAQLSAYDVSRLILNKPGVGRSGTAVHPNFDHELHVAKRQVDVDPHAFVTIGVDAGSNALIPSAQFAQRRYSGQWCFGAEIYLAEGQMTTPQLGEAIRQVMNSRYPRAKGAVIAIDPAAHSPNASSGYSTAVELQSVSEIEVVCAPTNNPKMRRAALDKLFLARMSGNPREPMIVIDPDCVGLIQGLAGGFHYPTRGGQVAPTPAKNRFSHPVEAAEYAPLTIDGLDPSEGGFIRPEGYGGEDTPKTILPG